MYPQIPMRSTHVQRMLTCSASSLATVPMAASSRLSIPPSGGHLSTGFGLSKGVSYGEATPVVLAGVQA
jgi:hypothetical protein